MIKVFLIQIVFLLFLKVIFSNTQEIGEKYIISDDEDVLYYDDVINLAKESGLHQRCNENNIVQKRFRKKISILITSSQFNFELSNDYSNGVNIDFFGFVDKDLNIIDLNNTNLAYRVYRLLIIQDDFCVNFNDLNGYSPTYGFYFSFRGLLNGGTRNRNINNYSQNTR